MPEIYGRAVEVMRPLRGSIQQVQHNTLVLEGRAQAAPPGRREIGIYPRSDQLPNTSTGQDPNNPDRSVHVVTNGINITIKGFNESVSSLEGTVQDIVADNGVIWMRNTGPLQLGDKNVQSAEDDFEVYLSGNIVFRDGNRTVFADRLYYDVRNKLAYIVDGEVITPIPNAAQLRMKGSVRMKAEVLRMQGDGVFEAENAMATTSLLGKPSYKLRGKKITLDQTTTPLYKYNGEPQIDSETGQPLVDTQMWLVSENNFIDIGDVPVFYWPWMATDVSDPMFYIKSISYGNDEIMGNQFRTAWNPYQILGIRRPPKGTSWDINLDYFDKRGLGHGTSFSYSLPSFLGLSGATSGDFYYWGISDSGTDLLSRFRRNLEPSETYRYRLRHIHRQYFGNVPDPWVLTARIGKTSDRNFMEQYYNDSWFTGENETTAVELAKTKDNHSLRISAEYNLNESVSNANSYPRLDHYIVGQSLLYDLLTWHGHTRVEYAHYKALKDMYADTGEYLRQEIDYAGNPLDVQGEVFSTRHELDLPFSLGPVRCVPYVLGDYSHWGKNRKEDSTDRAFGQAGIRLNLPIWKVNPGVASRTWYVNGLAHKIDLDAEFLYADSNRSYEDLVLYDSLDDWSVEGARRHYYLEAFQNGMPEYYDARHYAIRSGIAGNVTSPVMELADSLTMMRFGMTHRWQTKRGAAGRRNIIDWITFSSHFNYYPEEYQNGGEAIGLIDYDFKWHVGDRVSIFSSGLFDTMTDGQQSVQLGLLARRPGRGHFSIVGDWFDGCISRTYLTLNVGYTMSEKYQMAYSTSYDLTKKRNVGHKFMFVRTGESFRILVGMDYNESTENWGFSFGLEPVFLPGIGNRIQRQASSNNMNRR